MLAELKKSLRRRGVVGTVRAVAFGARCQLAVRDKRGLEIGGPSELFRHAVPVYKVVRSLDNCVFSAETIWEGRRENDAPFIFCPGGYGRNRVVDAVDLAGMQDGEYDFILSCHSLEHIANPIKALRNWKRVAPLLLLVLPHCRETFDHRRPVTTLAHMIEDFERGTQENDLTHLPEVVDLCDFSHVTLAEGMTLEREIDNPRKRAMHHHVFDERNSVQLLRHCEYQILATQMAAASVFLLAQAH